MNPSPPREEKRFRNRRWIRADTHEIVKFFPTTPPEKGDVVLVDGERCRVVKVKVRWEGRTWHLERVKVEPA
jgi:hypothetical protein